MRWLSRQSRIPSAFHVDDTEYLLDGGTTIMHGLDENGDKHTIVLTQSRLPRSSWFSKPIGRLYFDRRKIPMRSDAEASILTLLEQSARELRQNDTDATDNPVESKPFAGENCRHVIIGSSDIAELLERETPNQRMVKLIDSVLDYVRSDRYGKLQTTNVA